jgi:hypothetical protein
MPVVVRGMVKIDGEPPPLEADLYLLFLSLSL